MRKEEKRFDFEEFKSEICHQVKREGDLNFIIRTLQENTIRIYWEKDWILEAFYLLAMVDYLSRIHDLPRCKEYADIRQYSLPEPLYPRDIRLTAILNKNLDRRKESKKESIPEFLRFNIIESEVQNVC